ncbi:hypothetical protein CEUSTIGMA_g5533.t1 [Chlamydomonas eustigma]|uniref:RNA helicase n=1 Tax=Chlamydomonas eustigma TaxID=1157962 RepID=A0A250X4U9_9CHLO|nr:hypothetical protein CEUSTIGMA_g5533.t1 [Chlamydomonas eustigma]|eukprot:GAX78091.1 hypothetical protein CEUSTIGMA_g5533.t1 [Chlamydomonas eustigma]
MTHKSNKRSFPYYSEVPSFELKRNTFREGSLHPGRENSGPRVFQQPAGNDENESLQQAKGNTDFSQWSDQQIKDFLDLRGGDYDDCLSHAQLVERALEVEANTGPVAVRDVDGAPNEDDQDDDDYDPLDAFMASVDAEVAAAKPTHKLKPAAALACDERTDGALDFMAARKMGGGVASTLAVAAVAAGSNAYDSDEEVYAAARVMDAAQQQQQQQDGLQYDSDDNLILNFDKKAVEALAPLDHASLKYENVKKVFYDESPEVFAMDDGEVNTMRRQLELRVSGFDVPKPVKTFDQCGFDSSLLAAITKAGYQKPTAVQAQALPAALSGRDVLGIAKTGSGKTAAFLLPMLVHIADQARVEKGEGPVGVIMAPTRELAEQIHKEARTFAKPYNFRVSAAFGGLSKYEQVKGLKLGCEIAVCTPGRIIDLIKMKACTLMRVTYLVFDEADRMFDMGFEPQVRSILGQVRPDRQTLLFSATMPRKVERLVTDALTTPVRITVGMVGVANEDVKQHVHVLPNDAEKAKWLTANLPVFIDEGEVIVFASQRAKVEALVEALTKQGVKAGAIHGDMDQYTRMQVLDGFRNGAHHVLVATDVAARGLDIKTLRTVINYDAAKDIETHIHRVGRTGRAGDKDGQAYSLLLPGDANFAASLVESLALGGQGIPPSLHELSMKSTGGGGGGGGKGGRGGRGGGRKPMVGGAGLGFGGRGPAGLGGGGAVSTHKTGSTFVQLPGFSKSSSEYGQESSSSTATAADVTPLPPPPPAPPPAALAAAAEAMAAAASNPPAAQPENGVKSYKAGRFKSSFVSSGTTGGDIGAAPTVILPKAAPSGFAPAASTASVTTSAPLIIRPGGGMSSASAVVPPPPVPVTLRPMYLQQQTFAAGRRAGPAVTPGASLFQDELPVGNKSHRSGSSGNDAGGGGSYNKAPPPSVLYSGSVVGQPPAAVTSAAAAAAVAAAQAVAARLLAQAPPGEQPVASPAGPTTTPSATIMLQQAQAAAIAARFAAQAPPEQ